MICKEDILSQNGIIDELVNRADAFELEERLYQCMDEYKHEFLKMIVYQVSKFEESKNECYRKITECEENNDYEAIKLLRIEAATFDHVIKELNKIMEQ